VPITTKNLSNLVDLRAGENFITLFPEEIVLNITTPPNNIVSKFDNIIIKSKDLCTLCGTEWLNDQGTLCFKSIRVGGFL